MTDSHERERLEVVLVQRHTFEWGGTWRIRNGRPDLDRPHMIPRFMALNEAEAMLIAARTARASCAAIERGAFGVAS